MQVGVLWRDDSGGERVARLGGLFDALAGLGAHVVHIPFSDERAEEVRAQLRGLDGVLVWVNPIQDGANREEVDTLLRGAAANGVWVSAHPDAIRKIGTKEVLFQTRHLGWGSDTSIYRSVEELAERLPDRLASHGRLVVKVGRGNGGNGVWSVALVDPTAPTTLSSPVYVRDARTKGDAVERVSLTRFVELCGPTFSWSGMVVDQEYQHRLAEGMIRCYFSQGEVVGFCHQWPTGLLDDGTAPPRPHRTTPVMEGPDAPAYQLLRQRAERQWVPEMLGVVGLDERSLPVIWDADFLFGTREDSDEERYVLCEINVSAVWPFPPMASSIIAANTVARIAEGMRGNGRSASEE